MNLPALRANPVHPVYPVKKVRRASAATFNIQRSTLNVCIRGSGVLRGPKASAPSALNVECSMLDVERCRAQRGLSLGIYAHCC
jgi:hypothetical protein